MINDKLRKLIELLTDKTKKKEAVWNKASGNNQFKLLLPNNIAVTISYFEGDYNDAGFVVSIYNSNGDVIQKYYTDQNTPIADYNLLSSFHQAASDTYYRVEETFDTLIQSVMGQGTIGTIEATERDTEQQDELPF